MCFTPQRRAMFWHRNFIKWPERVSFLAFWLPNVLCATASNNFLTSELQKVARTRQFFSILTCKCASCNFSTAELQKVLLAVLPCFVHFHLQMCFSPQRPPILEQPEIQKAVWHWGALCIFYFSTHPTHESFKKHSISRLPQHLAPINLLSSDFRAIASSFFWLDKVPLRTTYIELLRTTKYYFVLHNFTMYYSVLQSITPYYTQ